MDNDLHIDSLTAGRRPLKDTDSSDSSTAYDPNLRHLMVDDPVTGRRPAIYPSDLWNYGGDHQSMMVDDLTLGRHPMGSDPIAALLGTSEFYAPLTHSLILTRGTGNPTYTRATNAWEFDNEGKLILVPQTAARFGGARMVRNLLATTGTLSTQNVTTVATSYTLSFYGTGSVTLSGTATGTLNGTGASNRVQTTVTATAGTLTLTVSGSVTDAQLENVTGQADQTASEYVSVGVLSAPYHGAGVDGVKWFDTNKSLSAISESSLLGYHAEGARTNSLLYSRDLTNAAWAATNITPAKTATGIDNAPNSASTLTASAADATILQTLTLAAAARSFSAYVKRRTGSGSVYITRDGGTSWTDITSSLGASWTRVKIENSSVLNPSVGFKIATSGDEIDVDVCQDEAGAFITSPIITTTAAVTRNEDRLLYQKASNMLDASGSALCSWCIDDSGSTYGAASRNALVVDSNGRTIRGASGADVTTANIYDGVNSITSTGGAARNNSTHKKAASAWESATAKVITQGGSLISGTYDGTMGAGASIDVGGNASGATLFGYIKNVYTWTTALTDAQLVQVTT